MGVEADSEMAPTGMLPSTDSSEVSGMVLWSCWQRSCPPLVAHGVWPGVHMSHGGLTYARTVAGPGFAPAWLSSPEGSGAPFGGSRPMLSVGGGPGMVRPDALWGPLVSTRALGACLPASLDG